VGERERDAERGSDREREREAERGGRTHTKAVGSKCTPKREFLRLIFCNTPQYKSFVHISISKSESQFIVVRGSMSVERVFRFASTWVFTFQDMNGGRFTFRWCLDNTKDVAWFTERERDGDGTLVVVRVVHSVQERGRVCDCRRVCELVKRKRDSREIDR